MNFASRLMAKVSSRLRCAGSMARDRRGVAAVEFAFIVPVLLCMYFMTMEASQGIEVNKKVSRMGSSVADLITQRSVMTKVEVAAIMKIGEAIIQPYNRTKPALEVTAIELNTDPTPKATVAWSMKLDKNGNPVQVAKKGDPVSDSQLTKIRAPGAFYIRVRAQLGYKPVIAWSDDAELLGLLSVFNNISMGETFYLRPRISTRIPCADCP